MEIRPHSSSPSAYVGMPPPCHGLFKSVRDSLLQDMLVLAIIKGTIYAYTSSICDSPQYANRLQNFKCHENLFLRAIHLFTLVLYSLGNCEKSTQVSIGEKFMLRDIGGLSLTEIMCNLHDSISKDDKLLSWVLFLIQQLETLEPCKDFIGNRFEKIREQSRLKVYVHFPIFHQKIYFVVKGTRVAS